MMSNVTLDRIGANGEFDLISMYNNENDTEDGDSPFQFNSFNCSYYEPPDFQCYINTDLLRDHIFLLHLNCRSLSANWDSFHELICN